jgi:phosphoglycerol transferase MdoB-like AlkP superfamily enzyme
VRLASSAPLQFQMLHGHFYDGYHLTSWFTSALNPVTNEALKANFPGVAPSERLSSAVAAPPKKPPNIILILHESTIDPRRYQPAERARFKEDPFVSGDGATRKLIVETFGGRTWISEYGAMFGLSTHYFSPNQTFLGYLLEGKIRHSLAHALGQQGYGSTYVYPAPRAFTNTGPFYKTLGFERVVDYHDRRKPSYNKRDREHFDYVVRDLKARREARDTRPILSFVMTEATHFPWSDAYFPDVRTDEIRPGEPWSEYARRIRIAHDDLTALKAELARSFPDEQFLLVGFGDHHPTLTAPLIADTSPTTSERYETFYRVEGVNFTPSYEAAPASIEIGYLANVIMAAAGLPLDDSFRLRQRTMTACGGLMYRCKDQDAIIAMHRHLVERGDIIPRYTMAK